MSLLERLASFRPFEVLVVGDFMLDEHVYGAAERLSPDAPVPVLQASRSESHPGGAANVALCLRAIEGRVRCFGVTGEDREAETLRTALVASGCDVAGLVADATRPTTIKRSMIGLAQHRHPQKMFRVDYESRAEIPETQARAILARVAHDLARADVVCLEDYGKGVCTPWLCRELISMCRAAGKPLLVDPAAIDDYSKYRGATAVTPNRTEAELATGLDTPVDATDLHNAGLAKRLLESLDLDAVVLTLDRHGALLEERGGEPQIVPTVARSVYDVTGAGDIVLAALAGAVANGFPWLDAVRFANAAAGLEVEAFGVQPIPLPRVRREVMAQMRTLAGKVRSREELLVELDVHREAGQRIVLTNGCFDVIHAGHVAYLREARELGDVLVVGLNTDDQVREQKGQGRPIYTQDERLEILSALESVDYVILFPERTARELIDAVQPAVYVKGGDYAPEAIAEYEQLRAADIDVRVLAFRPGLSSTDIIERMLATRDRITSGEEAG